MCSPYFVGGILVHICCCFPKDMKAHFKERAGEELPDSDDELCEC